MESDPQAALSGFAEVVRMEHQKDQWQVLFFCFIFLCPVISTELWTQ